MGKDKIISFFRLMHFRSVVILVVVVAGRGGGGVCVGGGYSSSVVWCFTISWTTNFGPKRLVDRLFLYF